MQLALLYTFFAAIATFAKIAAQDLTTRVYHGPWHVLLSVFVGTDVGLVVNYLLDKEWIFRCKGENARHDATLYTLCVTMGIITTAIVSCESGRRRRPSRTLAGRRAAAGRFPSHARHLLQSHGQ